jgi:hypothetical protein
MDTSHDSHVNPNQFPYSATSSSSSDSSSSGPTNKQSKPAQQEPKNPRNTPNYDTTQGSQEYTDQSPEFFQAGTGANEDNKWHVDPYNAGLITTADADDQGPPSVATSHSGSCSSFASSDHSRQSRPLPWSPSNRHSGKAPSSTDKTKSSTPHDDSLTPGKHTLLTSLQRASTQHTSHTLQTTDRPAEAQPEAQTPVVTAASLQNTPTPNPPTPMDTQTSAQALPSSPSTPDQPGLTTVPGSKSKRKANESPRSSKPEIRKPPASRAGKKPLLSARDLALEVAGQE